MTEAGTTDGRTGSADYSAAYYFDGHLGPPYTYEEPHWQVFFGSVADAVIRTFEPRTTYDAGCAIGLFVRSLLERGIDARGGDISEYAVTGAPDWLRERLEVRDLTKPFEERYDLISCIEVLEHMSSADAQVAIANLCAATDTVLLSSTPDDFTEPTHINVRTGSSWAQDFARQGFYRRTDIDASFLSPWAVVYSRGTQTAVETVGRYEALLAPLWREVVAKRQALLEVQRDLDQARSVPLAEREDLLSRVATAEGARVAAEETAAAAARDRDRLRDELVAVQAGGTPDQQLARLALVDELVGLKAELVQARIRADRAVDDAAVDTRRVQEELDDVRMQLHEAVLAHRKEIDEVRASITWRLGRAALVPSRVARRVRSR